MNVEVPHDCGDTAFEELAGEQQWMRCPRPSKFLLIDFLLGPGVRSDQYAQAAGSWWKRMSDVITLPVGAECKSNHQGRLCL